MRIGELKGYLLAALAAAAYGTNPVFAVPLYEQGMNPASVLLFRYILSLPLLAMIMMVRRTGFVLRKGEIGPVVVLGLLMALSSLMLFQSYEYMNVGVASTLLFVYPVLVAVLMVFFFHEKFRATVGICLAVMSVGLILLMKPQQGEAPSPLGCLLVMFSALSYALYIVMVNVNKSIRCIPTTRLLFYVLLFGSALFVVQIATGSPLTLPHHTWGWGNLVALAVIPTIISLGCTTRAIQLIGSTPTAILGALEPVSAVVLGIIVLGQTLTTRELLGGLLILVATTLVVAGKPVDRAILHVRKMFPRRH